MTHTRRRVILRNCQDFDYIQLAAHLPAPECTLLGSQHQQQGIGNGLAVHTRLAHPGGRVACHQKSRDSRLYLANLNCRSNGSSAGRKWSRVNL